MYQTYSENVTSFGKNLGFDNLMSKLHERRRLGRPVLHRLLRIEKRRPTLSWGVLQKKKAGSDPDVQPPVLTPNNRTSKSRPRLTWALMHVVTGLLSTICPELRFGFNSKNAICLFYVSVFPCGWCKYRNFVSKSQQKEYFLDKFKIIQSLT